MGQVFIIWVRSTAETINSCAFFQRTIVGSPFIVITILYEIQLIFIKSWVFVSRFKKGFNFYKKTVLITGTYKSIEPEIFLRTMLLISPRSNSRVSVQFLTSDSGDIFIKSIVTKVSIFPHIVIIQYSFHGMSQVSYWNFNDYILETKKFLQKFA